MYTHILYHISIIILNMLYATALKEEAQLKMPTSSGSSPLT